jgi:preprotein translocase subunit SecG
MVTVITILHVLVCVFLVLVVLLQAGKGGGMGLAFGSSGAQTVFGGSGAGNFLTRLTAITAVLFMLTSLLLAYFSSAREGSWATEYEKQLAAQIQRDREARERLKGTAPPAAEGDKAATPAEEPIDQPATGAGEGATSTPAEGSTTPPATGAATAPPATTAPAPATTTPPATTAPAPATTPPAPAPAPANPQPQPR